MGYCKPLDVAEPDWMEDKLGAMATLLLESKLECTTSGKYAYGCGGTWSSAESYAGAAAEAFATAWAEVSSDPAHSSCSCGSELDAQADVTVAGWVRACQCRSCCPL